MSRLDDFRERRNSLFFNGDKSPLTPEQKSQFHTLNYYPENEERAFVVPIEREGLGDEIVIDMTDGKTRTYVRYGRVTFTLDGREESLTVLNQPGESQLFLLFFDGTSGNESHFNGRYLQPQLLPDGQLAVDFNFAYNPHCAYSDGWSCPIPPAENHLDSPIEAGEKRFFGR